MCLHRRMYSHTTRGLELFLLRPYQRVYWAWPLPLLHYKRKVTTSVREWATVWSRPYCPHARWSWAPASQPQNFPCTGAPHNVQPCSRCVDIIMHNRHCHGSSQIGIHDGPSNRSLSLLDVSLGPYGVRSSVWLLTGLPAGAYGWRGNIVGLCS